jgi:hypothetical protein
MDQETAAALQPSERLGNYFVVIGTEDEGNMPEKLDPHKLGKVITDILVLNPSKDTLSEYYELVTVGKGGRRLNLKTSRIFQGSLLLGVEYNGLGDPITDIMVCVGDTPAGWNALLVTPSGQDATIGMKNKQKIYLAVRRDIKSEHGVTNISSITKKQNVPPGYTRCETPLTFGAVTMNDTFLVYERAKYLDEKENYRAHILDRYPVKDYPDSPLLLNAASFCLPEGLQVELFDPRDVPMPMWYPFVLTEASGRRIYGASLVFWEPSLSKDNKDGTLVRNRDSIYKTPFNGVDDLLLLHKTKCIAVMSHHPFFSPFKKILQFLYRISLGQSTVPIERYISHFLGAVPSPSMSCRHVIDWRMGVSNKIIFERPSASELPLVDLSFLPLFHMLDPVNVARLLSLMLLEEKILLISCHMPILAYVAEAVRSLMFPMDYNGVYIPMCSHELVAVLDAPVPFLVGMNADYVRRLLVPRGVWCIDIDNNSMFCSMVENSKNGPEDFLHMQPVKSFVSGISRYLAEASVVADGNWAVINAFQTNQETMLASSSNLSVDGIRNEALKMMTEFLKQYRSFLLVKDEKVSCMEDMFDKDSFVISSKPQYRPFLYKLVETQCFGAFIQERSFPSSQSSTFVFFDMCLDIDEERQQRQVEIASRDLDYWQRKQLVERDTKTTYEMMIKAQLDEGARSINTSTCSRKSLGVSRDVAEVVFEGPSRAHLGETEIYQYCDWPTLDVSLYLPEKAVERKLKVKFAETVAVRTEAEMIVSLQADKSVWQASDIESSVETSTTSSAAARAEALLAHFYGLYGLCSFCSLGLTDNDGGLIGVNDAIAKKRLKDGLVKAWKQIATAVILLDEAAYRGFIASCANFGSFGKWLGEEIFQIAEQTLGKVSALTYSQFTKLKVGPNNGDEPIDCLPARTDEEDFLRRKSLGQDAWIVMWSKQECPGCKYKILDEEILSRFEETGFAATVSCPCCERSFQPQLSFKSYLCQTIVEKLKASHFNLVELVDKRSSKLTKRRRSVDPSAIAERLSARRKSSTLVDDLKVKKLPMFDRLVAVRSSLVFSDMEMSVEKKCFEIVCEKEAAGTTGVKLDAQDEGSTLQEGVAEKNAPSMKPPSSINGNQSHGTYVGSLSGPGVTSRQSVAYMSLVRLRQGFENVVKTEGIAGLQRGTLRLQHPDLYWNLVWYCSRLGLPVPLCTSGSEQNKLVGDNGFVQGVYIEGVHFGWSLSQTKKHISLLKGEPIVSLRLAKSLQSSPHKARSPHRKRAATVREKVIESVKARDSTKAKDTHYVLEEFDDAGISEDDDDEKITGSSSLIEFCPDIQAKEEAWRTEMRKLMKGGYFEEAIISFLQLRMSNQLLWPSASNSIYREMRKIWYEYNKFSELDIVDDVLASSVGKPPNKFEMHVFERNFNKALCWLSPHHREEIVMSDTCGCGLKEQMMRWSFGELW